MDKGCTNLILSPFINGMVEASSNIEIFYTQKLSINP